LALRVCNSELTSKHSYLPGTPIDALGIPDIDYSPSSATPVSVSVQCSAVQCSVSCLTKASDNKREKH
jgi:hypothetical protein